MVRRGRGRGDVRGSPDHGPLRRIQRGGVTVLQNTWSLLIVVLFISGAATLLAVQELIGGSEALAIYGVVLGYVFGVATEEVPSG